MKLSKVAALSLALVYGLAAGAFADCNKCGDAKCCDEKCCEVKTKKVCHPEHKTEKVKKPCWEVECKTICIPRVKFPWESCCDEPKCARARTVKFLKKSEKDCGEKTKLNWNVVEECCPDKCAPACGSTVIVETKPAAEKLPVKPNPEKK